ncbi:MAG: hypothetical protein ABI843_11060 [Dokdonella sp.]
MKTLAYAMAAAVAASIFSTDVEAQSGNANAQDLSVHINLLGLASLDVTPQAPSVLVDVSVSADVVNSLPGVTVPGALLSLSTGLLTSEAQYADGGTSASGATVTVAGLDISAVSLLGDGLISMTADVVTSTSIVSGYCLSTPGIQTASLLGDYMFSSSFDSGNLQSTPPGGGPDDGAKLTGLTLSILGIAVPDLPLNPPPNTGIDLSALGIAGATLMLNEQTLGGDGVNSVSKSSNAVHLALNVASLITADVVVGHSDASMTCAN